METESSSPLGSHVQISTVDTDEFRTAASQRLSRHRLTVPRRSKSSFHGKVSVASLADIEFIYLEQGTEINVEIMDPLTYYDIVTAVAGTSLVEFYPTAPQGHIDAKRSAILSPDMRARMRMSTDFRQFHLRVDKSVLLTHLEKLAGRPLDRPPVFQPVLDLSLSGLDNWGDLLHTVAGDTARGGPLTRHPLGASSVRDSLLTGLLVGQPHDLSHVLTDAPVRLVTRRTVRLACDHIEENLSAPLTVPDIAHEVNVSVRALQRAFRDQLNTTPAAYIQTMRLARARSDLVTPSDNPPTTVTDTAFRWGFTHPSRFAAAYRATFGESPSTTLANARDCH